MENINVVIPYSPEHTPERFLDRTIESIENQTVSTRPIVIEDEEQRGPAWARNVGLSRADSQYVAFCDADDYWDETKLEKQLDQISKHGCSLCITQTVMSDTGKRNVVPFDSTEQFVEDVLWKRSLSFTSSILIDTNKTEATFDEELNRREDHLFALQAAANSGAAFVSDSLTTIHKHEAGLSEVTIDFEQRLQDEKQLYSQAVEAFPQLETTESAYWHQQYHRYGRKCYFEEDFDKSYAYLKKALSYQFNHRTLAALGISYILSKINN